MAMISLNLGLMNLLPIPILDGGVMTMLAIESLMGRDLSLAVKERVVQVGLVFLLTLMVFVVFNLEAGFSGMRSGNDGLSLSAICRP